MAQVTIQQAFALALQQHQAGRLQEAEQIYRQILAAHPNHSDALLYLGILAHQVGRIDDAVDLLRRSIDLTPNNADAYCNLANSLRDSGRIDKAIAACRRAIFLKPDMADAHNNLAIALFGKGQLDDAIAACRQAIALRPSMPEAFSNLGNLLAATGRFDEAIAACRQAVALRPNMAEAHNNLGISLAGNGRTGEAVIAWREAITLSPNYAGAYGNLGNVLMAEGQLDEAITIYRQAITLAPRFAEVYYGLGVALAEEGQLDEAIESYRRALELKPEYVAAHSGLLLSLLYRSGDQPASILAEHRAWADAHARPLQHTIKNHRNDRSPDRRLRVGYVSADFRHHPVGRFLLPLLEHHDAANFEIYSYNNCRHSDELTDQFKSSCHAWREIAELSDEDAAEIVRSDAVDILVDLSGHTHGNRLLVFARKPAPVQITYLGYPSTTGITAIDYRLTDGLADPAGMTDEHYVETLTRLRAHAWCYQAPADAPDIQTRTGGPITFGCFNAFAKISPKIVAMWADLLNQVPGSRLLLKSTGAGNASSQERLIGQFIELGISGDRIDMRGRTAHLREHLNLYGQVDIALDTYPYNGTTTTCEALWMGVPVVTLAGGTHVSRVGVSLLTAVGLPELIAQHPGDYVRLTVTLASDKHRLDHFRSSIREQMERSPLMNGKQFATDVEKAYRQMWKTWSSGRDGG